MLWKETALRVEEPLTSAGTGKSPPWCLQWRLSFVCPAPYYYYYYYYYNPEGVIIIIIIIIIIINYRLTDWLTNTLVVFAVIDKTTLTWLMMNGTFLARISPGSTNRSAAQQARTHDSRQLTSTHVGVNFRVARTSSLFYSTTMTTHCMVGLTMVGLNPTIHGRVNPNPSADHNTQTTECCWLNYRQSSKMIGLDWVEFNAPPDTVYVISEAFKDEQCTDNRDKKWTNWASDYNCNVWCWAVQDVTASYCSDKWLMDRENIVLSL